MRSRRVAVKDQKYMFLFGLLVILFVIIGSILFGTIKAQAAPADASYKYYTSIQIQKGDTLWGIASSYITDDYASMDDYIAEICSINHISAEDIHSGEYLTIPYYSSEYLD